MKSFHENYYSLPFSHLKIVLKEIFLNKAARGGSRGIVVDQCFLFVLISGELVMILSSLVNKETGGVLSDGDGIGTVVNSFIGNTIGFTISTKREEEKR
jgi:hypothetical protein